MLYADVIVDITRSELNKFFQYRIPERLEKVLRIGMRVNIPFGAGNRQIDGYVVGISETLEYDKGAIKEISGVAEGAVPVEGRLVALAGWMADHYGSTMIQALKTVLPVKRGVKAVKKRTIRLAVPEDAAAEALRVFTAKKQSARERLLSELLIRKEMPYEVAAHELRVTTATIKALVTRGLIMVDEARVCRAMVDKERLLPLGDNAEEPIIHSPDQSRAIQGILEGMEEGPGKTFLLFGVTASGKTEVYMSVIDRVIAEGGQVIVLVPEIALTYQTVSRFYRRFGGRVAVMNSRLSAGEKYDQFTRAGNGEVDLMIGPRSALFTPFPNLKLILIDEEQESAYRSETSPRYHAVEVARQRARMEGASVLLGSATPSIESFSKALSGEYELFRLPDRIKGRAMAEVSIVDMRRELREGNRSIISNELDELIRGRLARKEQVMLFLNRRGYAGFVSCRECGYVVKCEHCDVSMSEHSNGKLVCHYCGSERPMVKVCPKCGSARIGGFRAGTQQVEKLVRERYPEARVLRMDMDTTRGKTGHEKILASFAEGNGDILIGTQMIVKGHDLPNVTLVGALAADLSLHADDFRAAERAFQLLTQACGRAGRGERGGNAVIQTYDPDHYAITYAAKQDYEGFFNKEILYRELMDYPPAASMLAVLLSAKDEALLDKAAYYLKRYGDAFSRRSGILSIGPAAPSVSKVQDVYRKVLYYKHQSYDILVQMKNYLEKYMEINSGFRNIMVQYDFE